MARNKKVEILSNEQEVLHPMTDGDCVIFEDGQTLTQKLSEDDSVKYTPEIVNSSPMFKVGEGNTVDYSDNALDGAYERATLQGQTYVNYIQESSADEVTLPTPFTEYERTQHNTLTSDEEGTLGINLVGQSYVNALQHDSEEEFVVLGESLEFQEKKVEYTNEGQIKSAMLKGQTLVNLDSNGATIGTLGGWTWSKENGYHITNKPTDKTCGRNFRKKDGDFTQGEKILIVIDNQGDHVNLYGRQNYYGIGITFPQGLTKRVFTIPENCVPGLVIGRLDDVEANIKFRVMFLEYQEGMENWDIPYFEGMQSVTVSTRLENLCHKYNDGLAKNGKTFTVGTWENRGLTLSTTDNISKYNFKPNTKYLVQFKVTNLNLDGLSSISIAFSDGEVSTGNSLFGDNAVVEVKSNGIYREILTTSNVISTSNFVIKGLKNQWENSDSTLRKLTISEIMYVEYQNGMENWDLPYFEDYQVMKPVQVESVSKNLLEVPNISMTTRRGIKIETNEGVFKFTGTSNGSGGRNDLFEDGNLLVLSLKKGKTYTMSIIDLVENGSTIDGFFITDNNTGAALFGCNSENKFIHTYTSLIDMDVHFGMNVLANETYNSTFKVLIEESDTPTSYVPHQSKTTYSWDEVILRKVGDVEDTLDLTTGEWVQRIGEITYDGSNDEAWDKMDVASIPSNSVIFRIPQKDMAAGQQHEEVCNTILGTLPTVIYNTLYNRGADYDCMSTVYSVGFGVNAFYLHYKDINTMEEFRQRLKTNPVKVQYVLTKPIVHKVNLSRPNLQIYDDITHVHTKCLDGTLIPNIYLPSDVSYPAILEPGKKYNVCVNQTEVSTDNPLKVNVGGTEIAMTDSRMTLTTPTTLANSNVSFTGKGNKIKESMLIKNSSLLTRDLPHFNGIGSVQLGKTIENLCGSNSYGVGTATFTEVPYNDKIVVTVTKQGSLVYVFELTRQLENGKQYYVYVPNTYPTNYQGVVGFRKMYNGTLTFSAGAPSDGVQKSKIIEINQTGNPYTHLTFGRHGGDLPANTVIELQRPIICEYEPGMENWDWESIGYFTGTKNIGNEFMRVQNKNLFDMKKVAKDLNSIQETITENSDTSWTIVSTNLYSHSEYAYKPITFKENTRYTISMDFATSDTTKRGTVLQFNYTDGSKQYIYPDKKTTISDGNKTIKNITFTYGNKNITETISNIQLEESSTATTYTAHKHNGLYITKDQPINLTWEQGKAQGNVGETYTVCINNVLSTQIRPKGLINLKPNTTYRISLGNTNYRYHLSSFDSNDCQTSSIGVGSHDSWNFTDSYFTTTKNIHKFAINISKVDNASITPSESVYAQVRLEEVTDVVLRGIGDIHDELDITRGIYTQRINEIMLDGSEAWTINTNFSSTYTVCYTTINDVYDSTISGIFATDKFNNIKTATELGTVMGFYIGKAGDNKIAPFISSDKTTTEELRQWLKTNPVKVQYKLATPIIHKVHIGNKNEANTEIAKPNDVFTLPTLYTEQTHIDLTNNGIMPKVQSRDYIAYPIIPMISRTYTLQHNLTGGVSNLTVDLLGRTQSVSYQNHKSLVYSPETMDAILHNELRISGKGKISGVMYIDGGYMDRDIPYIEGMKNAVNPIVKNVGKNLFDGELEMGSIYLNNGVNYDSTYTIRTKNFIPIKSSTQYILNNDKNYDQNIIFYDEQQRAISHCSNTIVFITPINAKYLRFRCAEHLEQKDLNTKFQLEEGNATTPYIEYKENICYVDCGELRLTPDMFEQGGFSGNQDSTYEESKANMAQRYRIKELFEVEPNTTYNIRYTEYDSAVFEYGKDEKKLTLGYNINKSTLTITTSNDCYYLAFNFVTSTLPTQYVSIIKVSEIKQLRSLPNGVRDEIDLETGKYIQRVGEVVLNGSENWVIYSTKTNVSFYYYYIDNLYGENWYMGSIINDKLEQVILATSITKESWEDNKIAEIGSYFQANHNGIGLFKSVATVSELQQYLQQNPITVQYKLEKPIVKDIVIHNYPHSYEGGHVIIESGDPNTPIPAQLVYRAVTNRSGQIQQHTEQVEKQDKEINELETLILANIHLSQTR